MSIIQSNNPPNKNPAIGGSQEASFKTFLLSLIEGSMSPNIDAAIMIPPAKPRIRLFVFGPKSFLKKKTKELPNVVAKKMMDSEIIDVVIAFMLPP